MLCKDEDPTMTPYDDRDAPLQGQGPPIRTRAPYKGLRCSARIEDPTMTPYKDRDPPCENRDAYGRTRTPQ